MSKTGTGKLSVSIYSNHEVINLFDLKSLH